MIESKQNDNSSIGSLISMKNFPIIQNSTGNSWLLFFLTPLFNKPILSLLGIETINK